MPRYDFGKSRYDFSQGGDLPAMHTLRESKTVIAARRSAFEAVRG
jgi:hypothetical protein